MRVCECLRLCCVIRKKTYNLERMEYQVEKHIRMNKKIYIYILGADRVDELGAFRSLYLQQDQIKIADLIISKIKEIK